MLESKIKATVVSNRSIHLASKLSASRHSLHSYSRDDTIMSSRDDYWVQKVDKLMKDKKQVIKMIKDKNHEIRSSKDENMKLAQALKQKDSLIEKLKLEQMLKR